MTKLSDIQTEKQKLEGEIKDSIARIGFAYLCPAQATHLSYNFLIIIL